MPTSFLLRLRRRWSLALLVLSVLATIAAAIQAHRAMRSQSTVLHSVQRGYSDFAAWSYQQHLENSLLSAAGELLGPVNHGAGMHTGKHIPHASELVHYLPWFEQCYCHRTTRGPSPTLLWAFTLGSDTVGIGLNWHRPPDEGWLGDPTGKSNGDGVPVPAAKFGTTYRWINDTVTAQVRVGSRPRNGYVWIAAARPSGEQYIAYRLMPTVWGDTVIYGAQYDSAAFTSILRNVLYQEDLLPATFGRAGANSDNITVQVSDPARHTLFASRPTIEWHDDAQHELALESAALRVRAQIRPGAAEAMVIGGTPRSRLPFLFVLLALAAGMMIVAFAQLARESDLARAREGFVSSVSHELRTPLAQIRLYLETLRAGRADDAATAAWSLRNIDRETQRLSNLVDKVLRFSSSTKTIVSAEAAPLDIASEAQQIVDEFKPLADARRANITVSDGGSAPALISSDAFRHILLNLLDNAVKYGPIGQTVRVRVERANGRARVVVDDEGPGIPESERASIWEPFRRGESQSVRAAGGTGIGLTIVRDLVAAHDGSIRVGVAPGGGASFVVELP